ncbi:MAG: hypothetical protein HRU40_20115, partial [Saprospiraceae bacterium]|nr:hypothetical protein [Saprospiraceae bacterium]
MKAKCYPVFFDFIDLKVCLLLLLLFLASAHGKSQKAFEEMVYTFSLEGQHKSTTQSAVIPVKLTFTLGEQGDEVYSEYHQLTLRENGSGQV